MTILRKFAVEVQYILLFKRQNKESLLGYTHNLIYIGYFLEQKWDFIIFSWELYNELLLIFSFIL